MPDAENQSRDQGEGNRPVDRDMVLELNFVPQWARRPPDQVQVDRYGAHGDASDRRGQGRRGMRPGKGDRQDRDRSRTRDRSRGGQDRREKRRRRDDEGEASSRAIAHSSRGADRHDMGRADVVDPEAYGLTIRFLPEQKAITGLIKRITGSGKAYPLLDLASLLMAQEGLCFVKIEQAKGAVPALYQCQQCYSLSLDRERLERHVQDRHMDAFLDVESVDVEPPSGTFVCVAKCGMSGRLLGPPNHHRYNEMLKRVHAELYPEMPFDDYRERTVLSHQEEDVERWKAEASTRTVYRMKSEGEEPGEELSWSEAQRYMRMEIAPKQVKPVSKCSLTEAEARAIDDGQMRQWLHDAWGREMRFPINIAMALRSAFRKRNLHVFKTGKPKAINFVMPVKPAALDPETAIPDIRDALVYLQEHPGCTREAMLADLLPGIAEDDERARKLIQPIHWLVEKGHIIEFFNGTLSVPLAGRSPK